MGKEYIVQKAVAPEKVVKANRKSLEYMAEHYEAQSKNDGCCAVITLFARDMAPELFIVQSRTGEIVKSMDAQAYGLYRSMEPLMEKLGSLVVIAEAWWEGKGQFSEISGAFRKKSEPRPRLRFVVNDILTLAEHEAGYSDQAYHARMGRSAGIQPQVNSWLYTTRHPPGTYGDPRDLCAEYVDKGGFDGVILRDPNAGWKRGSGTEGGIIKLKRELSFDLRVKRVETAVGEKTGRTVYTLVVEFDGRELGVGSGLPHDFAAVPVAGGIVEIVAMDYSSDGLLREPRYKGIRHDKLEADR